MQMISATKLYILILCGLLLNIQAFASEAILSINNNIIKVELAITEEEHRKGLMNRTSLGTNNGMLFIYDEPQLFSFWMKNTLIPLDIIFISSDNVILEKIENIPLCHIDPCNTYNNRRAAQYVLELPAGNTKKLGLTIGDVIEITIME